MCKQENTGYSNERSHCQLTNFEIF
jgi:hypothetical protein